jgi:hypothetical protein
MAPQGSANPKAARRRPKSDVLTKRQFFWILGIGGLAVLSIGFVWWRGFPVGGTIVPIFIGVGFIIGVCLTVKNGVIRWRGGGRTYRTEEPFAFWIWVSIFAFFGLFSVIAGIGGFFKR